MQSGILMRGKSNLKNTKADTIERGGGNIYVCMNQVQFYTWGWVFVLTKTELVFVGQMPNNQEVEMRSISETFSTFWRREEIGLR